MKSVEWADVHAYIKMMRDFEAAHRDTEIAKHEAWAEEAAARGDEWGRKFHLDAADRRRRNRFDWETDGAGGAQE
jgi:hypothetical protein